MVGITSDGTCTDILVPTLFTDVRKETDWINGIIKKDEGKERVYLGFENHEERGQVLNKVLLLFLFISMINLIT